MERLKNTDPDHIKCQVIMSDKNTCDRIGIAEFKCVIEVKGKDVIENIRVCDRHKISFEQMKKDQAT